ncbi:hypothetical protein PAESOLCIP111_02341 [Paenibacillus solanacearum]|uniref:Uncharacterized protein n=1 Tax=Paenibacillus solanacearum TaxID=2048548 RepID=A0A916K0M2_9BACL|nr:hypothetical protein PAESOLCIP111_02341 [Paenibacillus solanacearum]
MQLGWQPQISGNYRLPEKARANGMPFGWDHLRIVQVYIGIFHFLDDARVL